ncbi:hypothetical protein ILUMI_21186 [Ignelater luminosus]|uniref:FCP1 homology domain-containing protein n=1 Tax=Ignelater luminosus TaxID=2038154 RepID=A0A8K0CJB2_IGNLU|nr:hypothetical protein ILUMI_21186 [Ignelater luminosus]
MDERGDSGQEKCVEHMKLQKRIVESQIGEKENTCENKSEVPQLKLLGKPRPNKKLLVLDIDRTIYDCATPPRLCYRKRPHLNRLLEEAFKHYDIGLWSATDMKSIEAKIKVMHLDDNSKYNFLFYMDESFMEEVMMDFEIIMTKPLSKIWNVLHEYGPTNTIICDDNPDNFIKNPRNGILVSPYNISNFWIDNELLYLQNYLEYLSGVQDVREIDHENWKEIEKNLRK